MSERRRVRNTPLVLGILLVAFTLLIAFAGPYLAPHNPLDEVVIKQVDGEWISVPFPPFRVPGYPLGTDSLGRDVLSQALWALRPTLIFVGYAALLRLLIGITLGILAGWNRGLLGSLTNALINVTASMPTLLVALAVVALAGVFWQPWGIILGLVLTGWADSARLVREQTRLAASMQYVEASRALGQGSFGIIFRHILRQLTPYIGMLLPFEISSTLLITAGLGFLGYYAGGEVWVMISDTVAGRLRGMPELGQMLSSVGEDIYVSPWKLIASGTLIFITVLGFNLLGEGLRRTTTLTARPSRLREALTRLGWKIDERFVTPLGARLRAHPLASALVILLLAAITALGVSQVSQLTDTRPQVSFAPGGQLWSGALHDPAGTMWSNSPGVRSPALLWTFHEPDGLVSSPVVAADGRLYLITASGALLAVDAEGVLVWKVNTTVPGVASPALDASGNVYIADMQGGLSSFSPAGQLRWHYQPVEVESASSSPTVAADGNCYYLVSGDVVSISPEGALRWQTQVFNFPAYYTPIVIPSNDLVFVHNRFLDAASGELLAFDFLPVVEHNVVGLTSLLYSRAENKMITWEFLGGEGFKRNQLTWSRSAHFGFVDVTGVLADSSVYLLFNSGYEDTSLVFLSSTGDILNRTRFVYRPSLFAGIDREYVFYICGNLPVGVECSAVPFGKDSPEWTFLLENASGAAGVVLVPERLYVVTVGGDLFALGNAPY